MKSLYGKFTWPEIKATDKDRVVLLPVGAMEDHGPHLPLDTDNLIITRLAEAVVAFDSRGNASVADHPFRVQRAPQGLSRCDLYPARNPDAFCMRYRPLPGASRVSPDPDLKRTRLQPSGAGPGRPQDRHRNRVHLCIGFLLESHGGYPEGRAALRTGGMAHAGELETAIYLYFDPQHVQLDKARANIVHDEGNRYLCLDLAGGARAMVMQWWSAQTDDGTMGDPTAADAGKGKIFFEAAVRETVGLIREIRRIQIKPRRDHH